MGKWGKFNFEEVVFCEKNRVFGFVDCGSFERRGTRNGGRIRHVCSLWALLLRRPLLLCAETRLRSGAGTCTRSGPSRAGGALLSLSRLASLPLLGLLGEKFFYLLY
jgi:hypothetical protein